MVKQANNYEKQWQTFLGIKETMQKFLGSRDFELKTYKPTSGFMNGEQGIMDPSGRGSQVDRKASFLQRNMT